MGKGNPNHGEHGHFSSGNAMRDHEFEVYKAHADHLEKSMKEAKSRLKDAGGNSGQFGMTPDSVKSSDAYRSAKADVDSHFSSLRKVNEHLTKNFGAELKAERAKRGR